GGKYRGLPRPWVVLGLGASHSAKDWPAGHWAQFVDTLRRRTAGTVFLVGGAENALRAQNLIEHGTGATAVNACALSLVEAAALMRHADLFVGTDSGPMNLAAAAAIPTFALFGSTPILTYSKFIHAVQPDDGRGPSPDGMTRIFPAQV